MKKKFLGFVFIFLAVVITVSNINITGAVIGTPVSSSLSFVALVLFVVGTFAVIVSLENRVVDSKVKDDPLLLRVAESVGRKESISRDINHLIERLNEGDNNPGIGTKTIFKGVYELRGRNGGRVYVREVGEEQYEILGYSDKDKTTQRKVINRLKQLYS